MEEQRRRPVDRARHEFEMPRRQKQLRQGEVVAERVGIRRRRHRLDDIERGDRRQQRKAGHDEGIALAPGDRLRDRLPLRPEGQSGKAGHEESDEIGRSEKTRQGDEETEPAEQADAEDEGERIDEARLEPVVEGEGAQDRIPATGAGQREQQHGGETSSERHRGSAQQGQDRTHVAGELGEIGERHRDDPEPRGKRDNGRAPLGEFDRQDCFPITRARIAIRHNRPRASSCGSGRRVAAAHSGGGPTSWVFNISSPTASVSTRRTL